MGQGRQRATRSATFVYDGQTFDYHHDERLRQARAMLGGVDALDRFHEWESQDERD